MRQRDKIVGARVASGDILKSKEPYIQFHKLFSFFLSFFSLCVFSVQAAFEEIQRAHQDEQYQIQLHHCVSLHPCLNIVRYSKVWWVLGTKVIF